MRNALRLLVLVLALCAVGATAALLQAWVHRRTADRQHLAPAPLTAAEVDAWRRYDADEQNAFLILAGVSFAALLALALVPVRRPADPATPESLGETRRELKTTEHLARAAASQGEALVRERDVRQRAEQDLQLQQQLVRRTLEEKIRLGRDLHDGTIQSLYATGLVLESARDLLARESAPADAAKVDALGRIDTALRTLNDTIISVRRHIQGLSSDNARGESLAAVLASICEELRAGRDVEFVLKIDDTAASRLSAEQTGELIPFVREAVSNALRHGRARHVTLRLHEGDAAVCLLVLDDGVGFSPTPPDSPDSRARAAGGGHGLANMRARAEAAGGRLALESAPGSGTRIVFTLPLPPAP